MPIKNQTKMTQKQRKTRVYQIIFIIVSIIVLLSMILSMVAQ
jgi:predicted nucleic acid-binding Zn ribbon protein